jgi:hypothetical protein
MNRVFTMILRVWMILLLALLVVQFGLAGFGVGYGGRWTTASRGTSASATCCCTSTRPRSCSPSRRGPGRGSRG